MKNLPTIAECFCVSVVMISLIAFLGDSYASLTKQEPGISKSKTYATFKLRGPLNSYKGTHGTLPDSTFITSFYVK